MKKEKLECILDELLEARDKLTRSEIDAACCQTDHDFKKYHKTEEMFQEIYAKALKDILELGAVHV